LQRRLTVIKTIIRTENDEVMVFDEYGEQMPEYQGYYAAVKDKILADATETSTFSHWFGVSLEPEIVPGEAW
jgi:hypothetical protein